MRCAEVALQKLMTKEEWDTTVQEALYRYVHIEPNGRGDVEVKESKAEEKTSLNLQDFYHSRT